MAFGPATKSEAEKYRYGQWAGCPRGHTYDPQRCAATVWDRCMEHQCLRKPTGSIFCKQHTPKAEAPHAH